MFGTLVRKEITTHLLDLRFIVVFGLCAVLTVVGVYAGIRNYSDARREYDDASQAQHRVLQEQMERGAFDEIANDGVFWHRPPEVLSPLIRGLSGTVGRSISFSYNPTLKHQPMPHPQGSRLEAKPVHGLFGELDLAFVVHIVLSLAILLFTHDCVCGEKEAGTLRLQAAYPVSRATLALSKLTGSTIVVMVPLVFASLLAATVFALWPGLSLSAPDWARIAALLVVFVLYLTVFAAFGIWFSALTQRRLTSFLLLLGVWAGWIFVLPNLAVRVSSIASEPLSFSDIEAQGHQLRWELANEAYAEIADLWRDNPDLYGVEYMETDRNREPVGLDTFTVHRPEMSQEQWDNMQGWVKRDAGVRMFKTDWDELGFRQHSGLIWHRRFVDPTAGITKRYREEFSRRMALLTGRRRNEQSRQRGVAALVGSLTPLGASTFAAMDLARVGPLQQEHLNRAVAAYHDDFLRYIWSKEKDFKDTRGRENDPEPSLEDFQPFTYRYDESLGTVLQRNVLYLLNLALLALLGFAGAFGAILRYDVR